MNIEDRLRTVLADRAEDIDRVPPDPFATIVAGVHRQNRRRAAGLLAAAACAAVVAVGVPLGADAVSSGGNAADQRAAELASYTPYPQAPRGSLAGDPDYLAGLLKLSWGTGPDTYGPPLETRAVAFAGEVPGGVRAYVTGWADGGRVGMWLAGPSGAAPADLAPLGEPTPDPIDAWDFSSFTVAGKGALVVLARPGDLIEVSPGLSVITDGTSTPAPFQPVGDATGTAVVDAGTLSTAARLRITSDGQVLYEGAANTASAGGRGEFDPTQALGGAAGDPDPALVRLLVEGVATEVGVGAGEVTADVLWGGPIGAEANADVKAAVLSVRLPSGAVVAVGGYSDPQQSDNGGDAMTALGACLRELKPAGTVLNSVAMRCDFVDLDDGANTGSQLVVVPPPGTTLLRLIGASGARLDNPRTDGPAYIGPAPEGVTTVQALDGGGTLLADLPLGHVESLG